MSLQPESAVAPQRAMRGDVQWPCGMAARILLPWPEPAPRGSARGSGVRAAATEQGGGGGARGPKPASSVPRGSPEGHLPTQCR
eukprot:13579698-Alexandrium_andersonii.AAC.1